MSDCLYHYLPRAARTSLTPQVFNLKDNVITAESVCTYLMAIPRNELDRLKLAANLFGVKAQVSADTGTVFTMLHKKPTD